MNIIQQIYEKFLLVGDRICDLLEGGCTYVEFERDLDKELRNLGANITKLVLEAMDETVKEDKSLRPGWKVVHKGHKKNILTVFGNVEYSRRYYSNEDTDENAYLVDRIIGVEKHGRIDSTVKANVVDLATELSYGKAALEIEKDIGQYGMSRQTVMNILRRTAVPAKKTDGRKKQKRVLYVEADEDHVSLQFGKQKSALAKLVYIHEGIDNRNWRPMLKNARYFAGVYEGRKYYKLWEEVWEYIENTYDVDKLERIFVSGDGASWIYKGVEFLPNAVFVLDRYHLTKYINSATVTSEDLRRPIYKGIDELDFKRIEKALKEADKLAETKTHKKAVRDCKRYIKNNWEGIEAYQKYSEDIVGCSAESHVSHILSARLSTRPCGWSKPGVDKMSKLRAAKASGINIRKALYQEFGSSLDPMVISKNIIAEQRKALKTAAPMESIGNIPILQSGASYLRRALRGLAFPA
jgi:hypothetical protein